MASFLAVSYTHLDVYKRQGVTSSSESTGWLGRWLDADGASPLRAVGIGPTTPVLLTGEKVQGASISAGPLVLPGSAPEQALYSSLAGTTMGLSLIHISTPP